MVKKLHPTAIVPQNISTNEQIRAGFQEVLVDVNAIVAQWNETIQPLVDSLPGGRRRLTPADRTTTINPVENGFDGSQMYMDLASTPQILGGFLYNSRLKRPKTIKEVIVDSHISLQSEMSKLRVLVDEVDAADTTYDDTDVRNWIRRLAADTISDLDQGDPFGTGYFGEPTKTLQYSLHQRDVNLRTIIGLDADYGITNPGFDGTNYIDDMDIIDALIELDSQVSGAPTAVTLQDAYDNGDGAIGVTVAGGGIILTTENPLTIPLTIITNESAFGLSILGNIGLLSSEGDVGYLGNYDGTGNSFYVKQANGKILKLGNEAGISTSYGYVQNVELITNTWDAVEWMTFAWRITDTSDEVFGGIHLEEFLTEDLLRTQSQNASVVSFDIFVADGYSPKGDFKNDGSVANREANDGLAPFINGLYRENIVKAVFSFYANASATTDYIEDASSVSNAAYQMVVHNVHTAPTGTAASPGVDTFYSWYDKTSGQGQVLFLQPISSGDYTISCSVTGVNETKLYTIIPYTKSSTDFYFKVYEWDGALKIWTLPTENITIDFQVI